MALHSPMNDTTPTHEASRVRYAFIGGAAAIVDAHIEAMRALPIAIVGMADIDAERGPVQAKKLLGEARPDAVVICTPHPFHAEQARASLGAGAHVLVEKPMAVDAADADSMIEAAERARRILAVNFQERFRPAVERARDFIARGELGDLVRVLSVEPWLRTAAYYRSSAWRGSWRGEGGGVLMNQAPHTLDILCHLLGMPARVWGMTRTRGHAIEAEDSAQAMLEYPNGGFGYVAVSTIESGTERRLEILGDRACVKLPPLRGHIERAIEPFAQPRAQTEPVTLPPASASRHHAAHRSFYSAIRNGRPPWCDGKSGLMSLELANAITLSSFTEKPVSLPLDRTAYTRLLSDLRAG